MPSTMFNREWRLANYVHLHFDVLLASTTEDDVAEGTDFIEEIWVEVVSPESINLELIERKANGEKRTHLYAYSGPYFIHWNDGNPIKGRGRANNE